MIFAAEYNSGQIKIEISNPDDFVRRVKKEMRRQKRDDLWKIRLIGQGRTPAAIQQLINRTEGKEEAPVVEEPETTEQNGGFTHKGDDDHNPVANKDFKEFLRERGAIT